MDIGTSHACNLLSLELIAEYYGADCTELMNYYRELETDSRFLSELNKKIDSCRDLYPKGIFLHQKIDSIDWFGNQRVVLYVLIRLLKRRKMEMGS